MTAQLDRRSLLRASLCAGAAALVAPLGRAVAAPIAGDGPYGPLQPANGDGLMLPAGFRSRPIAVAGEVVPGSAYTFPGTPDGAACVRDPRGGWVYLANSELPGGQGGVTAIRFDAAGRVGDAYSVLQGTSRSCSGGVTPWGTYLSGEENGAGGRVFECDPFRAGQGVDRPALGRFAHEMCAVDPGTGWVYMVEDDAAGRLYRFRPARWGDLSAGVLEAARVDGTAVSWGAVDPALPARGGSTTAFNGGEGAWIDRGALYLTTKGDVRVWRLDLASQRLSIAFDLATTPGSALTAVDNLCGHAASGDLFVAEDGGNMEACLLTTVGPAVVAPFLRFVGHDASEVTGVTFEPSGNRLYVTSQRGTDGATGRVYEISGPFRRVARRRGRPAPRTVRPPRRRRRR